MTSSALVTEQLTTLNEEVRHHNEGTSRKLQKMSLMAFLWPILPILPPEPPRAADVLLKEDPIEKCDLCGCPGSPIQQKKGVGFSSATSTGKPAGGPGLESPLTTMMVDIEKKMNATLTSIENTTQRTNQLDREAQEMELTVKDDLTNTELLNTLKSLMKEKAVREDRVKVLERKEQQLKDSLRTAIDWAKNIDAKDSKNNKSENDG